MLEAVFITGVDEITVTGLAQWDRGQMLRITYPSIPSAFQVHFANKNSEKAIVVQATGADDLATVAIPDELLREPLELFAWLYFDESLTGETAATVRMPVKARTMPDDYITELPQEQATEAEKIIMRLMNGYVEEAKEQADRAERAADNLETENLLTQIKGKGDDLEYDKNSNKLYLISEGERVSKGIPMSDGVNFSVDSTLNLDTETGVLSVNTADSPEADNTLPITAAAVYTTVGNIEVLLETI